MDDMAIPYPSLADFAATFRERGPEAPPWVHPTPIPLAFVEGAGLRDQLEDLLDTVVAVQRADWVQAGVYLGPRSMPDVYRDLLDASRTLGIAVPPAVVSPAPSNVYGTDDRALLHLNSFFLAGATPGERRFLIGRLCGHVAARQVTWVTCWALLVDQGGIRTIARQALGPALEVFLAPISFGARLALNRWHRAAEITADRAGLIATGNLDDARKALLRAALGVTPKVKAEDYLEALKAAQEEGSPSKWAELLENRPFMHKRMRALALFARSETWVGLGHPAVGTPTLTRDELETETARLLQVG
jgi:hypothetical protein